MQNHQRFPVDLVEDKEVETRKAPQKKGREWLDEIDVILGIYGTD